VRARLLIHVRERPDGAAVVTPVQFPDLAAAGDSAAEAVERVVPNVVDRLAELSAVDLLAFLDEPKATLERVPASVRLRDDGDEPLELVLGIVVVERELGDRTVRIAHSPVVPEFTMSSRGGSARELAERAAKRLVRRLGSWPTAAVLAADEPPASCLDVLQVDLPPAGPEAAAVARGILEELGVDLTEREGGRIDRRDELVVRALEMLAGPGPSSLLLVGRPGVGKTALVHEIARRISLGQAPPALAGRRVFAMSANELIAGAQYTGMWQDRLRRLVDQARRTRAIVAMGDPVAIVDAGRWSQSDNNASRYLRPYVESGDITIVCECTEEQLAAAQKKEPSFVDAFHRIDVPEPTRTETTQITRAAADRLAEAAGVEVDDDAIAAAVELTQRFEPYRSFPGKCVRLLEDAVRERPDGVRRIDREVVTEAFARRTGMPLSLLSDVVPLSLDEVRRYFEARVLGQPDAVAAMTDVIAIVKAGLTSPDKPLASFFFVGPTGVGKTELAKAVAEFLFGSRDRVLRLDMGEYASHDAVAKLIGTAWGAEGVLTRLVRQQPFCVVLLDELEKAHPSVFDALLSALGEGRLTDASGRTADFRNAIVIMTSNLGAARAATAGVGFGSVGGDAQHRYVEEAERFFRPEFFNRIDRIVVFHSLTNDIVRRIARRELDQLLEREGVVRRGLRVEVDDAVVEHVAAVGFHPRYGARPLQREIEQTVIGPLAHALLRRPPGEDELVRIHLARGSVVVTAAAIVESRRAARRSERRAQADDAAFARARRAAEAFVEELRADDVAIFAADVRSVVSGLIEATHQPTFWDEPERARAALQQIFRFEAATNRLEALEQRALGLVDMAARVHEARDRARVAEVGRAIDEMRDALLVVRLELGAAASGAQGGDAVLRVVPVGAGAAGFADRVLRMYGRWADRTGRDVTQRASETREITIDGLATIDLLRGEAGLHRHVQAERVETLVRVVVSATDGIGETPDVGTVVRVYEEGSRRVVRDPRTRVRETRVSAVLDDGVIDRFLIAALRSRYGSSQPS